MTSDLVALHLPSLTKVRIDDFIDDFCIADLKSRHESLSVDIFCQFEASQYLVERIVICSHPK